MERYYGFYRARVTEVDIPTYKYYGAVRIFVPDIMMDDIDISVDKFKSGLIAYPANSPMGGRNSEGTDTDSYYQGTVYVPTKESYVWVFFERGDIDRPFYVGGFNYECAKLPVENITNDEGEDITSPSKVYTVVKTPQGRSVILSDDEGTQRVEISGKRRTLSDSEDSSGSYTSGYTIDDNMTTILLDERTDKQKLLVRTYKGDFIHVDIDERKLQISFDSDINISTNGDFSLDVGGDIQVRSKSNINLTARANINILPSDTLNETAGSGINVNTGGDFRLDASIYKNKGIVETAKAASPKSPEGSRNT